MSSSEDLEPDRTASPASPASRASVATARGARYGKQLASHLGRRLTTSWDETAGTGVVTFDHGRADLSTTDSTLELTVALDPALAAAAVPETLERIEDVVGRHLARFGAKDELVVAWVRADGSAGAHFVGSGPGHED